MGKKGRGKGGGRRGIWEGRRRGRGRRGKAEGRYLRGREKKEM